MTEEVREKHDVCCDTCKTVMYRTDGRGIFAPTDGRFSMTITPIVFTVAQRLRVMFCTKGCVQLWLGRTPEEELRGGYPLW